MLYAADVRLGRVGKEVRTFSSRPMEVLQQLRFVYPQLWWHNRHIGEPCAFRQGKLANAVYRVVIVEREQILPARVKWISFTDKFERPTGIGGKDRLIFLGISVEIL